MTLLKQKPSDFFLKVEIFQYCAEFNYCRTLLIQQQLHHFIVHLKLLYPLIQNNLVSITAESKTLAQQAIVDKNGLSLSDIFSIMLITRDCLSWCKLQISCTETSSFLCTFLWFLSHQIPLLLYSVKSSSLFLINLFL